MKNNLNFHLLYAILVSVYLSAGCTSVNSFGTAARAGDTVALGLGWQQDLTSQNVTVTITDSIGASVVYLPGDAAIRAIFNSYPDPLSKLIIGAETGQDMLEGSLAGTATLLIDGAVTSGDKDYAQTFMLVDLPGVMATGFATINIADALGNPIPNPSIYSTNIDAFTVEILPDPNFGGVNNSNDFLAQENILVTPYLKTMERASHFTITLQGATIPYGVQLELSHNPDVDTGGVGRAYVVNPRGDLKNVNWTDSGSSLKIVLLPARNQTFVDINQFKFYVAGGIENLQLVNVTGYDVNGSLVVPAITATID